MQFVILSSAILTAAAGLAAVTRQAQMLQQNSYYPSRYIKWLRGAFSFKATFSAVMLAVFIILLAVHAYPILLGFSAVCAVVSVCNAVKGQKKSIKPLVFTARVKRQYATLACFYTVLALLTYFVSPLFFIGIAFLAFVPCCAVLLVRTVNTPAEKAVTRYYINDAKKILKQHGDITVIGITGSYGKTGTKYMLASLLEQKYNVVFTPASFNTPLGVVRTIREKIRPETQVFIAEMGAKNIGDIKEICDIVSPDIGIITSVGAQHLETFKTVENVAATKFELAESVKKRGGTVFLNFDNDCIKKYAENMPCVSYGSNGDVTCDSITYGEFGSKFTVKKGDTSVTLETKLLGAHNVENLTGAIAVAMHMGVKAADIAFAAARLKPVEHRLQLKPFLNGSLLIDDAYNANPDGCLEAVRVLGRFDGKQKIIVTPGLIELGEKEYECNFALGEAAAQVCDEIILVGIERSKPLKAGAEKVGFGGKLAVVPSFADAMNILKTDTNRNTVVLFENDLPDNYLK